WWGGARSSAEWGTASWENTDDRQSLASTARMVVDGCWVAARTPRVCPSPADAHGPEARDPGLAGYHDEGDERPGGRDNPLFRQPAGRVNRERAAPGDGTPGPAVRGHRQRRARQR